VEWYLEGKTEEISYKPVSVPLCVPQIPYGYAWDRTCAFIGRNRRLAVWPTARFVRPAKQIASYFNVVCWTALTTLALSVLCFSTRACLRCIYTETATRCLCKPTHIPCSCQRPLTSRWSYSVATPKAFHAPAVVGGVDTGAASRRAENWIEKTRITEADRRFARLRGKRVPLSAGHKVKIVFL